MVCQGNHLQPGGAAQLDGLFFRITAVAVAAMHVQVGLIPGGGLRLCGDTHLHLCRLLDGRHRQRHAPLARLDGRCAKAGRGKFGAYRAPCFLHGTAAPQAIGAIQRRLYHAFGKFHWVFHLHGDRARVFRHREVHVHTGALLFRANQNSFAKFGLHSLCSFPAGLVPGVPQRFLLLRLGA